MRAAKDRRLGKRLEADGLLREQLAYCVSAGIPHSVFLGRVVGPGDPLWLPDDTDKVLAFRRWERDLCPRCATREKDWFGDDGEPLVPAPLEAVLRRCPGCAEVGRLQSFAQDQKLDMNGAYVALDAFDPDRAPLTQGDT